MTDKNKTPYADKAWELYNEEIVGAAHDGRFATIGTTNVLLLAIFWLLQEVVLKLLSIKIGMIKIVKEIK